MATPATDARPQDALLTDSDAGIATITLNRPDKYNSLSSALIDDLQAALDACGRDERTRVVVIAARGKAFCAGHDLKEMRASEDPDVHQELFERCGRMMQTIRQLPQPVIAQVQGIATAAGCQMVAACDLAVASEAARFAVSGINVGLFCSTPAVPLSRNISRKRAMHMLLTGDFIDAATACDWGLVNAVVPEGELAAAGRALAEKIAAKSAHSIQTGKKMFYAQLDMDLAGAYGYAAHTMACNMNSDDAREGIDAFFEKRSPRWIGR